MKIKHLYYLLAVAILFAGCMVGDKYVAPKAPENVSYRDSAGTDTTALMQWSQLYKDPVLQSIIRTTLENNNDLLSAASRIEEARLQSVVIKASMYPQLGYSAQVGGGTAGAEALKVGGGIQDGLLNAFGVLSWELDIWGKLRHSKKAAVAQFLASVQNRNALQVSLIAQVTSNYFLLLDLDNRLAIAKQTFAGRKENTQIISDRFDKGYIPELDKLQAIQQEAIVAATIPALERQIVQTENTIRLLMGEGPGTVARGNSIFGQALSPDIPVGLPSQLLQRRPDIMVAEKLLQAQSEQIGIAQANRFPSISLTGLLGFASPQLSTFISNKGFVANGFADIAGPLFTFGQRKNLMKVERQRYEQAYMQYQKTVLAALGDVDNSLSLYKTYTEEFEQRKIQAAAAEKALVLSRTRYDYGYTSYTEVILMENNLFDAQLQQSEALQGKLNAIVQLYKSLGGGW